MAKKPVPEKEARWIDENGRPTLAFLEYIKDLDQRAFNQKVSSATPANGDALVYVAATGLFTPTPN